MTKEKLKKAFRLHGSSSGIWSLNFVKGKILIHRKASPDETQRNGVSHDHVHDHRARFGARLDGLRRLKVGLALRRGHHGVLLLCLWIMR